MTGASTSVPAHALRLFGSAAILFQLVAVASASDAGAVPCSLAGDWFYAANPQTQLRFSPTTTATTTTHTAVPQDARQQQEGAAPLAAYTVVPMGADPGWSSANATVWAPPVTRTFAWSISLTFVHAGGKTSSSSGTTSECTVITFDQWLQPGSAPWCRAGNTDCHEEPPFAAGSPEAAFFGGKGASVQILEVDHSDIYWLGKQNDMLVDSKNIADSLDIMRSNPAFKWQHECILFLRAFVEIYPQREAELVQRIREGRFDIGGTFTEGFESTMPAEVLARQMYEGRRWFIDRYGADLDSAVVAFHQDGPLRALQMPQVYAKAGIRHLKASRLSDHIFRWAAPDGSSLLAFEEVHYGEPLNSTDDLLQRMAQWYPQFKSGGFPPTMHLALGEDYYAPTDWGQFIKEWASANNSHTAFGGAPPPISYNTFKGYLDALEATPGFNPPTYHGERPNLWWAETSSTHHWLFNDYRHGGRALPAAEMFASFRAMVEGSWDSYPSDTLAEAWLNLTLNDHGLGHENTPYDMPCDEANRSHTPMLCSLVNKDSPPFADDIYILKWGSAHRAAEAMVADAQAWLAQQVDTDAAVREAAGAAAADAAKSRTGDSDGNGHAGGIHDGSSDTAQAFVVFNSLSWEVTEPVEVAMRSTLAPLIAAGAEVVVRDSTGAQVPAQVTASGTLLLIATVPSLGYATYTASAAPTQSATPGRPDAAPAPGTPWTQPYSNAYFKVTPGKGGVASVQDLSQGDAELFDTSAYNVGEWMSLGYSANGASETETYRHDRTSRGGPDSGTPTFTPSMDFARLGNATGWAGWSVSESGPARVVFASAPVQTEHSTVVLEVTAYATLRRLDFGVQLLGWDNAMGVANRVVFPVATDAHNRQGNVTVAVPFGATHVGHDELEEGSMDTWLQHPGPNVSSFDRGYAMRPREVQDWVFAEGAEAGVLLSSSVGLFDWVDATGVYPQSQPVLAPELLTHTISNQGPFQNETGDHSFSFSLLPAAPGAGWQARWREAVAANTPLAAHLVHGATRDGGDGGGGNDGGGATLLPSSGSFLNVSDPALWVTAFKRVHSANASAARADDGVALRLFDGVGAGARDATVTFGFPVSAAAKSTLIELPVSGDGADADVKVVSSLQSSSHASSSMTVDVAPWSIDTWVADVPLR